MSNDPEVKMTVRPQIHDQFGKTKHLSKTQPTKKVVIACAISAISLIVFLDQRRKDVYQSIAAFQTPVAHPSPTVHLPKYSLEDEMVKGRPAAKKQIHWVYLGPELLKRPFSDQIPPGTMVKAKLTAGASDGLVKAITIEELNVNEGDALPAGTVFIGDGTSQKNRLQVRFNQAVFPDGTIQKIQAIAADGSDKTPGLKGSRLAQYGLRLAASAGLNFISGSSQGLREKEVKGGAVVDKSDFKNAALNGTSQAAVELARETMGQLKSDPPQISIEDGTPLFIVFSGQ